MDWIESEGTFSSWDGAELFYRSWCTSQATDRALIFLHRGHEHSGRLSRAVQELGLGDFRAFSWDMRGHGRSLGDRGHADNYYDLVRDLDAFVRFVCAGHGISAENIVIVANSVGAVTACAWAHDFAPRIRAMVLLAPAFRIRLYVPMAMPLLRMLLMFKKKAFVSSYVSAAMLTHDSEQRRLYRTDPLVTRRISVNVLVEMHDTAGRIMDDAHAITTPTMILAAGSDCVVKTEAQRKFYRNLGATRKEMHEYPGFHHALLHEAGRDRVMEGIREFVIRSFTEEVDRSHLLNAHRGGAMRVEYDLLRQSTSVLRTAFFSMQKLALRALGRLSRGIAIGLETGFDSGRSLDYVYEDSARGLGRIGRAIDRAYLDAIGWKGIRMRRRHLEKQLHAVMDTLEAAASQVTLLDVATGCGRYVLSVLKAREGEVDATLRDWDEGNLEQGRALASSLGLGRTRFERADAFDPESIRAVRPRPNVVIVSGLYELFPDNDRVLASLMAIGEVIEPGGYLVYTGQPWHPQLEVIARALPNRDGAPWIMRRRSQAELDEMVRSAGFEKTGMEIDPWGIFTVSTARRAKG